MNRVASRIKKRFSNHDLERQVWFVKNSLDIARTQEPKTIRYQALSSADTLNINEKILIILEI